jgi:hypothetical protein
MYIVNNPKKRLKMIILVLITIVQLLIIGWFIYIGFAPRNLDELQITQVTIGALILTFVSMIFAQWQGVTNSQKNDEILTELKKLNNLFHIEGDKEKMANQGLKTKFILCVHLSTGEKIEHTYDLEPSDSETVKILNSITFALRKTPWFINPNVICLKNPDIIYNASNVIYVEHRFEKV